MKDSGIYLEDALEFISQVAAKMEGVSEESFLDNNDLQDVITLKIIYIGEALNRIPDDFQAKHSNLPWAQAIGMRHRLAHDYGAVDPRQVWAVAKHDLPELARIIQTILPSNT
jgi:uncharacterized protein with HEPN domain